MVGVRVRRHRAGHEPYPKLTFVNVGFFFLNMKRLQYGWTNENYEVQISC